MKYRINNKTYDVGRIIYVEEKGNDSNDGNILTPVATVHQAVRIAKSTEYTVIEVGKGTFVFTSYYYSGSGYLEAILHDAWKPIIFVGKGIHTTLVLNQLSYRPTYENRHYKIQLGNSRTILTNFVIDINFPNPSGSAWGPNVWNSLFHLCTATICNNIFRIKTTTMGMGYYNDSSRVPNIYNNVFAGSYSLQSDYSGSPVYVNNLFIKLPLSGYNYYYSALDAAINKDIMNGDFTSLINLKILGHPNIFNPQGSQSILGPFGGELAMQIDYYLFALKIKDEDKYVLPIVDYYDSSTNGFKILEKQELIDLFNSGYINFFKDLCKNFVYKNKTIIVKEVINYADYEIFLLAHKALNEIKVLYNSSESEDSKSKSKLIYDFYQNFDERVINENMTLDFSPTHAKYEQDKYMFTICFDSYEDIIKKINVNILSNKYNLLNDVKIYKEHDYYKDRYFVKFNNICDKVIVNKIINQEYIYARDTLKTF